MITATIYYGRFDEIPIQEALHRLKDAFKSAKVTLEKNLFAVRHTHSDVLSLNSLIEDAMKGGELPTWEGTLEPYSKQDWAFVDAFEPHVEFDNLPKDIFGMSSVEVQNWKKWGRFVDLCYSAQGIKKIKEKKEMTIGEKILSLLNTKQGESQAILLLDSLKEELPRAELVMIEDALKNKINKLRKKL